LGEEDKAPPAKMEKDDSGQPSRMIESFLVDPIVSPLLKSLALLCWGFVGAAFYLLRRLYVYAKDRTFEPHLWPNYLIRLLMGGIAGFLLATAFQSGVVRMGHLLWLRKNDAFRVRNHVRWSPLCKPARPCRFAFILG
jgi:hypothetical protein